MANFIPPANGAVKDFFWELVRVQNFLFLLYAMANKITLVKIDLFFV